MRRSIFYIPTKSEGSSELIKSHNMMLKGGLVRQIESGSFVWLPLGMRVLNKAIGIVRKHMDKISSYLTMPCIQPAQLWEATGRITDYGSEMLKFKDRHGNCMAYAPSNEELVTALLKQDLKSYRELPINVYQVNTKFRDEIRPQGGVIRSKEFVMKDAYSCDLDHRSSLVSYRKYFDSYCNIFRELGVNYTVRPADNGEMGGKLSDEFFCVRQKQQKQDVIADFEEYGVMCKNEEWLKESPADGIEVGHLFNLGDKYSRAFEFTVMDSKNHRVYPEMGSYGIGVTRVIAAILEQLPDNQIEWPAPIAPFQIGLIRIGNESKVAEKAEGVYNRLVSMGIDVLYDDRDVSPGSKFVDMELIGLHKHVVVSEKNYMNDELEVKHKRELVNRDISQVLN